MQACGITGKSYTYASLRDRSAAFAINLQKFGLTKDDVVGICMPNAPEFFVAALGILEAGCTLTTFNPVYVADEVARQILHSNAKLLICLAENYETVRAAVALTKKDIKIVCGKLEKHTSIPSGTINFYEWEDSLNVRFSDLKQYDFDPNDTALLPYSSGTTGLPKGVMLSHRNIIADSEIMEVNKQQICNPTTQDHQEVFTCVLPLFHIYAFIAIFTAKMRLGCKVVTLPNFKPDTFLNALVEHKVTFLYGVPPLILFLGEKTPTHIF